MNAPAKSLAVFGVYLLGIAATLMLLPNLFLSIFGLPSTQEPWIRVVGLLSGVVGYYYLFAAARGLSAFYPATVYARVAAAVVFAALVATQVGPWQLVIFGAVDLLAAVWTHLAIRGGEVSPS